MIFRSVFFLNNTKNIAAGPDDRWAAMRCEEIYEILWLVSEDFEAHGLAGESEGGRGGGAGLVAAFRDYAVEVGVVVIDGVDALADRQGHLADVGRKLLLEVSVADGAVVPLLAEVLYCRGFGYQGQEGEEVVYALGHGAVGLGGTAVGQGLHDLLGDGLLVVVEVDAVALALAHLAAAVKAGYLDELASEVEAAGLLEDFLAVHVVETAGQYPGVFQVLFLVLAHGHVVRAVDQDVGGHQYGVGQQAGADVDALVVVVILRHILETHVAGLGLGQTHLVLEGGRTFQLALVGDHVQKHIQLAHFRNVALHEYRDFLRIQTGSQILGQDGLDIRMEIIRMGMCSERMKVRYEIEAVVVILYLYEIAQRSEVVAEMKMACGTDTA